MSNSPMYPRYEAILEAFSQIPPALLRMHEVDRVAELVMHHLCRSHCLGMKKAAYLINNPDYACLKGVSGWDSASMNDNHCSWDESASVWYAYQQSSFHKKVEIIDACALDHRMDANELEDLSKQLGFEQVGYLMFPIKYNNQGVFLYEKRHHESPDLEHMISRGACYLGLCPVF